MRYLDLGVILVYLVGITWFGARFRESQKSLKDYFLGGRNAPWWAIAFSIVSAETSTLTIIGTPALAFRGNMGFLQLVAGYLLARIVISTLFLPHYFRGELFTAYELMTRRFGGRIRRLTAGLFLILRALAEGVRVFAISLVVSIILGTGDMLSIFVIVLLTLFYTFEGGMTAVIWTDVVQMFLYIAGAAVSFFVMLDLIPGGWRHVWDVTSALGKTQIFDFRFDLSLEFFSRSYSFWGGVIGGMFLTTASHGTEQLMVQRLLSARNQKESRTALFSSWFVIAFQFTLFLVIGLMLFVYYKDNGLAAPKVYDQVYPLFVWQKLPPGISGLIMAAILAAAMSNLSAALNALASTTVMDFYKPFAMKRNPDVTESHLLSVARRTTVFWGLVMMAIGFLARQWGSVLEAGLGIASTVSGALLGVFLLGLLTRRASENAAMVGMVAGLSTMAYVKFGTSIAFTWYVLIGTSATFAAGMIASLVWPNQQKGDWKIDNASKS
ncbi:MAG: sodium/solute symporter [Candidatus Solibacter usitatus]|nr:sodium/solute symporter [Candidatus Solibacter usitatus]